MSSISQETWIHAFWGTPSVPELPREREIFDEQRSRVHRRTDRMFAGLMVLQWLAAVIVSLVVSPRTWAGAHSATHPHVWLAIFMGGALASLPVYLAWRFPGAAATRYVIAVSQALFSSLLIHVSGGRIETHFHVFGSLAFLAFYRDWRVLVPATALIALDHLVRGVFWPETVFGISTASPWRSVEHAAWVLYEDVFLVISCRHGEQEMWTTARRTAELERTNADVRLRTLELEQSYRTTNAIVETALDAVISMDRDGNVTCWNSQAEATFGWTTDEAVGCRLSKLIIPLAFRKSHEAGLSRFLETQESGMLNRRIEIVCQHRTGREFPVEMAIAPIFAEGSVSFCAFARDITERREADAALRSAKEAAEAANSAKSAFMAQMSHEIRTPLNGILGFADFMLRHPDSSAQDRSEYLQTVHDSGRHLLRLIDDILDLSKIESGQMEVECIPCTPHQIIAEVISILRVRAQDKGIHLEYYWKGAIPQSVESDPARFRQVLMNLVGNAIKFTEVGCVQVAARLETSELPRLIVDVIDSGIGIAPENLERVFQPFVQADGSITRRFGGSGLGLAISRQLIGLMGGKLTAVSTLGHGSTFTATLPTGCLEGVEMLSSPVADLLPVRETRDWGHLPTLPASRILLVEDGQTNQKLISLLLRRAGAEVEIAENGKIGVQLATAHEFDLIMMDMQMPVMDGYAATRELRRLGLTLPVIALTAHAMKGDEEKCRSYGCSGYLTKPIDSGRLLQAVAAALRGEGTVPVAPVAERALAATVLTSSLPLDDPDFREIAEEFVERLREKAAAMQSALASGDFEELYELAHWLKGAGGTAGFAAFTAPAHRLEHSARVGSDGERQTALDGILDLCGRIPGFVAQPA